MVSKMILIGQSDWCQYSDYLEIDLFGQWRCQINSLSGKIDKPWQYKKIVISETITTFEQFSGTKN